MKQAVSTSLGFPHLMVHPHREFYQFHQNSTLNFPLPEGLCSQRHNTPMVNCSSLPTEKDQLPDLLLGQWQDGMGWEQPSEEQVSTTHHLLLSHICKLYFSVT